YLIDRIDHGNAEQRLDALKLISFLGDKTHVPKLTEIARTNRNTGVAEEALNAAWALAPTKAQKFSVLFDVAQSGSKVSEDALGLMGELKDYRAQPYKQFLELRGSAGNFNQMMRLMDNMPDARGRQMVFDEALQM